LATGIAHEINTPTQYIYANIEFLEDAFKKLKSPLEDYKYLSESIKTGILMERISERGEGALEESELDSYIEEIPGAVSGILEGVRRISKIVDPMKYFSHPGDDKKQRANVNDIIESAIIVAQNEYKYCADMVKDLDSSIPALPCFAAEISQVLLNMLINATHAIQDVVGENPEVKGTIKISSRYYEGCVEIQIYDSGTGIPDEIRPRIFDPFFTTKDVGKGTGQGLSLAHSVIVDKHDGIIDLETELGHGTTFVIRLPLEPGAKTD
jgi:signal transduction histidine kinase